uniref:Uncharacterized protein n=1 Tax=Stomoxys calcitrans TaxID=35570 RepID=A0A1I8NXG7_STOCA
MFDWSGIFKEDLSKIGPKANHGESDTSVFQTAYKTFQSICHHYDWIIYTITAIVFVSCLIYYYHDCKRRSALRSRESPRTHDRLQQQRRPGAEYRNHQIFRNAVSNLGPFRGQNNEMPNENNLRRTRSGRIYGKWGNSN